jgi:hypothetical protein
MFDYFSTQEIYTLILLYAFQVRWENWRVFECGMTTVARAQTALAGT